MSPVYTILRGRGRGGGLSNYCAIGLQILMGSKNRAFGWLAPPPMNSDLHCLPGPTTDKPGRVDPDRGRLCPGAGRREQTRDLLQPHRPHSVGQNDSPPASTAPVPSHPVNWHCAGRVRAPGGQPAALFHGFEFDYPGRIEPAGSKTMDFAGSAGLPIDRRLVQPAGLRL